MLKTGTRVAVYMTISILGASCSEIVAVDDECNVDADCRPRGENLRCKAHLCVSAEDPQSDAGTGTDTHTNTSVDVGTDSASDVDTDADTATGTASDNEMESDSYTNLDVDTDTATDTNEDTDGDTNSDTDTESADTDTKTDTGQTVPTVLHSYTFTKDLEGFIGSGYSHDAENGYAEVELTFDGTNQIRDFEKSYGVLDWSDVVDINAIVKVDQFTSGGLQIFMKSGDDWNWCSKWFDFTLARDWATITMESSYCEGSSDMTKVRSIGIQIHSGGLAVGEQVIHVQIDEIFIRHIESSDTDTSVIESSDTGTSVIEDSGVGSDAGG